ncbi:hypothetical protein DEJ51_11545 [Streptomyces venezuelae]|uniref:Uncharacterized protein n=1 Tax=Streptomyces venezuelae TaxID=54571 RepID=A0A5P2DI59_STRVZ|nr:hypothetical protein [Streptomyces venezuelae]QES54782.1 hypothetical protein DEJ51_11545 [Streptomyces venezuelae]
MTRWNRFFLIVATVVLATAGAAVLLVGSLDFGPTDRFDPKARSALAGHWKSGNGGSMHIAENGDFSASNVGLDLSCSTTGDREQNPRMSGSGTWKFGGFPDEGPGFSIAFKPEGSDSDCTVWGVFGGNDASPEIRLLQDRTPEYYQRSASE